MKHLAEMRLQDLAPGITSVIARCGKVAKVHDIVEAALESDCDDCRARVMVGASVKSNDPKKVANDPYKVKPPVRYKAQPHPDADKILKEKEKKVDGK